METIYDRVRGSGQKRKLAAADFTVMVGNVPSSWGSARVREFFEKSFGDVVHVGLSLDYRQLIQAVKTTRTLKDRHNDLLLYLVQVLAHQEGGGGGAARPERQAKADVAKVGRARAAVIKSLARLEEHDKHIKGLMRARYRCTGYAFVTFDKLMTAQAAPHTTHHTPHTARHTPHTAHRTPHTAHRTPHATRHTPHAARHTPHATHRPSRRPSSLSTWPGTCASSVAGSPCTLHPSRTTSSGRTCSARRARCCCGR